MSGFEHSVPLGVTRQFVDQLVKLGAGLGGADLGQGRDAADGGLLRVLLIRSEENLVRETSLMKLLECG